MSNWDGGQVQSGHYYVKNKRVCNYKIKHALLFLLVGCNFIG